VNIYEMNVGHSTGLTLTVHACSDVEFAR